MFLGGCSGCTPGQPTQVVIYYREPFDFGNYYDSSGSSLILGPGITIPYISILCIENHSSADFNFDPTKVVVNLGNGVGNQPNNVGLITYQLAAGPPGNGGTAVFGTGFWTVPASLGMVPVLVARQTNFVAPVSFTAISDGADNDPNDQPRTVINGDPNHVSRHVLSYCTNASQASSPSWQCQQELGQPVSFVGMQDFNPSWHLEVQRADFAAAQIVAEQPQQQLPSPSCP
jgi:hypothetical protein